MPQALMKNAATAHPLPDLAYRLDDQIGFLLRQVTQRHATIFFDCFKSAVTPMQWAALSKLLETGPVSQNHLGRLTVMDAATIKGVIDRLARRGLARTDPDPGDARRRLVALTEAGAAFVQEHIPKALATTETTLQELEPHERSQLAALLSRMR